MTTKTKQIIISIVIVAVACAIAIVTCVLLLTRDEGDVPHVDTSGNIKLTLKRESLVSYSLDSNGKMVNGSDNTATDFTKPTSTNIFGLDSSSKVVPAAYYEASLVVSNAGDSPFDFWLQFNLNNSADAFAKQLIVTVTTQQGEVKKFHLSNAKTVGSKAAPIATVATDNSYRFTVKVYFDDDNYINDEAQKMSIYFDMKVCAEKSNG